MSSFIAPSTLRVREREAGLSECLFSSWGVLPSNLEVFQKEFTNGRLLEVTQRKEG